MSQTSKDLGLLVSEVSPMIFSEDQRREIDLDRVVSFREDAHAAIRVASDEDLTFLLRGDPESVVIHEAS